MTKLFLTFFLLLSVGYSEAPLGGFFQFKSSKSLVCRSDHYGTFLLKKRTSGTYEEIGFSSYLLTIKAEITKLNRQYTALRKKASTKANRAAIANVKAKIKVWNSISTEVKKCRAGTVTWGRKFNFTQVCSLIGGSSATTSGGIIAGERCLEGNSPTARIYIRIGTQTGLCTGTLVAPNIVITAAHCVDDADALQVWINRIQRTVSGAVHHPGYQPKSNTSEDHDVALIFLATAVTGITPAPIHFGSDFSLNETAIIGGYGVDAKSKSDILRSGYMFLSELSSGAIYARFIGRESNTCFGDSGGPIYVFRNGKGKIAGATSGGISKTCSNPDISSFVRFGGINQAFLNSYGLF